MKGDGRVIEYLNGVLKNELTAINQYFLHSRVLKNWGIERLAGKVLKESIEEMEHAQKCIDRILLLDGLPALQALHALRIGENVKEMLECDLALENDAVPYLKEAIIHCEKVQDFVSRDLFVDIQSDEEEHIDWIAAQLGLIEKAGIENYIAEHIHGGDS